MTSLTIMSEPGSRLPSSILSAAVKASSPSSTARVIVVGLPSTGL